MLWFMASHGAPVAHIRGKSVNFSSGDGDGLPEPGKQKRPLLPDVKSEKNGLLSAYSVVIGALLPLMAALSPSQVLTFQRGSSGYLSPAVV